MSDRASRGRGAEQPIRVAILNDYDLVVEGVAGMMRRYPERVRLEDVSTGAVDGQWVDLVLYDTFGSAGSGKNWSAFLADGWSPRYVVDYGWAAPEEADRVEGEARRVRMSKALEGEALVSALEELCATGRHGPAVDCGRDDQAGRGDDELSATPRCWPGKDEGLTERESEVLSLIVAGLSNKQIASEMFLGVNTIKTYIRSAYRTMRVTDRSHALLWGIDRGFRLDRSAD